MTSFLFTFFANPLVTSTKSLYDSSIRFGIFAEKQALRQAQVYNT